MNNKAFQDVFDEFSQYLPSGWNKLVIYLEYGIESYSFSFYVLLGEEYVKCYDLPDVLEENLLDSYRKVDSIISKIRNEQFGKWTNMTMTVDNEGNMQTDFDYTDLPF